jgi:hypothetical protein
MGSLQWWKEFQGQVMILIACSVTGTDKLLLLGRMETVIALKMLQSLPTKYVANRKHGLYRPSLLSTLRALDAKTISQNGKIVLFMDQRGVHPKDTCYLKSVEVIFFSEMCQHSPIT